MRSNSTNPTRQGYFEGQPSVRITYDCATRWCQYCLSLIALLLSVAAYAQDCEFTAGEIAGPTNACAHTGANGQVATYSVEATDASGFTWQVPAQATLVSGQGTNTIRVKYKNAFTSGAISVQIGNACGGAGASRTIQVGKMVPAVPLSIDGPSVICDLAGSGEPVTYTIQAVPGATKYLWSVPSNATLASGQNTTSITVLFASNFRSGDIMVRSGSNCGNSDNLKYFVSVTGPGRPGPITGQTHAICADNNVIEYNIAPIRNATSYSWTTTVAGAVIDNQGPKAIITFPLFSTGFVRVSVEGPCPVDGLSQLAVTSKLQAPPASVIGQELVCAGSDQTYSVDPVNGATNYDWTVPDGSTINSGNGSPSINVTFGQVGGAVTVVASSACDAGIPVSKDVVVEQCEPPTCPVSVFPNPTSGQFNVEFCAPLDGVYNIYVTDAITGQILYHIDGNYLAGENTIAADITGLEDGLYILYLVTEEIVHHENLALDHNMP